MGDVRALNLWLSLSRCGDEAPGLDIVPRRLDHLVATATEEAHARLHDLPARGEEARRRQPIMRPIFEPGDALFFDELFLHQTGSDPSMPKPRYAVENWFFGGSAFPAEYAPIAGLSPHGSRRRARARRQPRPSAGARGSACAARAPRRAPARAPGARRARAVVTIVHDEPVFLPLWLRYYSRFFAARGHLRARQRVDRRLDRPRGFVRIPAERDASTTCGWCRRIEALQHELLGRYDVVLVTDVDEVVAPARARGPRRLPRPFDEEWVNCLGYELLHLPRPRAAARPRAADPRPARLVVPQRRLRQGRARHGADEWRPGFHGRGLPVRLDPDLRLIHLHRMDYDLCLPATASATAGRGRQRDAAGWAVHNRITEEAAFARWFHEDSCFGTSRSARSRSGRAWRGVF